jgi:integrase
LSPYTSDMRSSIPDPSGEPAQPAFHKVGENLYRLESTGKYYALLKRGGKQFRRCLKTHDRKLAERRLATLRGEIENLTITEDSNLSFKEVADRWAELTAHSLKPSTITRRATCIKNLAPYFKGTTIRNITPRHCEAWLTGRGKEIAPQTFAHELSTMKAVFEFAQDKGLIITNPARAIKRRKLVRKQILVPSRDQFKQLIATIRQSDGRADSQEKAGPGADMVELLAYSGCRIAEATALRWSDVDFDRNCLTITGGEIGTKNLETRTIPMTSALRELLTRMKTDRGDQPGTHVTKTKDAKKCLQTACRKLEIPHFTHHDFRHFFATTCIESGVDIPTVSRWLGHKDGGALAMKIYGHLRQEHSFSMIKRVDFGTIPPENVVSISSQKQN